MLTFACMPLKFERGTLAVLSLVECWTRKRVLLGQTYLNVHGILKVNHFVKTKCKLLYFNFKCFGVKSLNGLKFDAT